VAEVTLSPACEVRMGYANSNCMRHLNGRAVLKGFRPFAVETGSTTPEQDQWVVMLFWAFAPFEGLEVFAELQGRLDSLDRGGRVG